jgi:hypothetical protein
MPSVLFWPSARTLGALALAALNAASLYHPALDQVREGFRHGESSLSYIEISNLVAEL